MEENGATSAPGLLASYSYDNLGHQTGAARGNGVVSTASFDAIGRLSGYAHTYPGSNSGDSLTVGLTLGPNGQIDGRSGSNTAYDWAGGTTVTHTYTVNGQNQVTGNTSSISGPLALAYDGRGNLANDGTNGYTYDVTNNLLSMNSGASLAYDALGRLAKTVGASTTQFAYDGGQVIGEYDGSGNLLRRYVPGAGVWYEGAAEADRRWLLTDERGSVIAVTNGSGAPDAINTYDEYGVPAAANLGRYQYTGQIWIPEVGLYHYNARAYSPTLGRFMQTDPSGFNGGMNLYRYAGDDPINGSDPTGLEPSLTDVHCEQDCTPTPTDGDPSNPCPCDPNTTVIVVTAPPKVVGNGLGPTPGGSGPATEVTEVIVHGRKTPRGSGRGIDLSKLGSCLGGSALNYYGLTGAAGVSGLLAIPIPKSIVPPFRSIGTPTTNLFSVLGHYVDISVPAVTIAGRTSTNLFRVAGRLNPYVAAGLFAVDASVIGYNTYQCYNGQ